MFKTTKTLIVAVLLLLTISLFGQPKPFDAVYYKQLAADTKSEEGKHYREYVEKYKKLGLPVYDMEKLGLPWSWEQYFYYHRINLDALNEFKALGIDLVKLGKDDETTSAFREMNYLDKAVFSNIIFIGEAVDSFAIGGNGSKYNTAFLVRVTEVLKGKEYYKNFPDTIRLIFQDQPTRQHYAGMSTNGCSESLIKLHEERITKASGIHGVGDMGIKLRKKCIVYLDQSARNNKTNEYYPGFNCWINENGDLFKSWSNVIDNINNLKDKIIKINKLNKPEFNHADRGK